MKRALLFATVIALCGCGNRTGGDDDMEPEGVTEITVTHIQTGTMSEAVAITATSACLKKNLVTAPLSGYVETLSVQEGDRVSAGQTLYRIVSKERNALGESAQGDLGVVTVKASAGGVVTGVAKQQGAFVTEGEELCTLADLSSFVFLLNVPYEDARYVVRGSACRLVMPDNSVITGTIAAPLVTMNTTTQTQHFIVRANTTSMLPEGMVVKALINKGSPRRNAQIVAKGALQSDVFMKDFWLMYLVNDTLAVKLPVTAGIFDRDSVEIRSPKISPEMRIVLLGSYELPDSSAVRIVDSIEE
ncbi:MAG: efflux RND transporter periplasmic adaptor subunit [Acidobacteriaceae bacterium]|nr:efflux RND transporter periplasmic adaptor subunit [Acidobacteriaceae bacterium]